MIAHVSNVFYLSLCFYTVANRYRSLTTLDGTTNDTANASTNARRQDDEGEGELLSFTLVDIGNKSKGHTTTSG